MYRLQHRGFALWIKFYTADPAELQQSLLAEGGDAPTAELYTVDIDQKVVVRDFLRDLTRFCCGVGDNSTFESRFEYPQPRFVVVAQVA